LRCVVTSRLDEQVPMLGYLSGVRYLSPAWDTRAGTG